MRGSCDAAVLSAPLPFGCFRSNLCSYDLHVDSETLEGLEGDARSNCEVKFLREAPAYECCDDPDYGRTLRCPSHSDPAASNYVNINACTFAQLHRFRWNSRTGSPRQPLVFN